MNNNKKPSYNNTRDWNQEKQIKHIYDPKKVNLIKNTQERENNSIERVGFSTFPITDWKYNSNYTYEQEAQCTITSILQQHYID